MAANYRTIVIGHEQHDVLVVDESGTTQRIILKSLLTTRDRAVMDLVEDTGTGLTFGDKLQSVTLKNGRTAFDTYQNVIVNTTEYAQRLGGAHFNATHIPIIGNSGVFTFSDFSADKENHYISLRFYDANDVQIPISSITAGTVEISASETPDTQFEIVTNGTITFTGGTGYTRPIVYGSYKNLKIELSGLTSSTQINHVVVLANSFE